MAELNDMIIFDNVLNSGRAGRVQFSLMRNDGVIPSPWEISSFLDGIHNLYYKTELLNSISNAFDIGINPANIFIFDKSFKHQYSSFYMGNNLDNIDLSPETIDDNIYKLYSTGLPFSFFPNKNIHLMNRLFFYCQKINSELHDSKKGTLHRKFISEHTNMLLNDKISYSDFLKALREYAIYLCFRDNKDNMEVLNKLNHIVDKAGKEDSKDRDTYRASYEELMDGNFSKEVIKAVDLFFSIFKRIKRPLVGIFYPELKKIQIIGKAHINKDYEDSGILDLVSMGHASPFVSDFVGAGATIVETLNNEKRARELHEITMEARRLDVQIKQQQFLQEVEKTKVATMHRTMAEMEFNRKLNLGLGDYPHNRSIRSHAKIKMTAAYQNNRQAAEKLLFDNNLELHSIDIIC